MGTRSSIAVNHNGVIKAVYCHYDGYLSNNGAILLKHYHSAKANYLVAMGNISSLGTDIGEAHDFEARFGTMCTYTEDGWRTDTNFYGRDRGEEDQEWRSFQSEAEWIKYYTDCGCEYFYLMDGGVWYVTEGDPQLVPLHEAIEQGIEQEEMSK